MMRRFVSLLSGSLLFISLVYAMDMTVLCYNLLSKGDPRSAITAGVEAIRRQPSNPYAYACLSLAFHKAGRLDLAIEYGKKAELLMTDRRDLMKLYSFMGSFYTEKGDLDTALKYYEEILAFSNDDRLRGFTYMQAAEIYSRKGKIWKAIDYYKKAARIENRRGNHLISGIDLIEAGELYLLAIDLENAYPCLTEGLKRVEKYGRLGLIARVYKDFGFYYELKGDKKLAREYMEKSYHLYRKAGLEKQAQSVLEELSKLK